MDNKPFSFSYLSSKPSRSFLFWKLPLHLDPNEVDALVKICTDDFKETTKPYHGHCLGCTTPYLNKQWCKACYCYEETHRGKPNWDNGPDMYLESCILWGKTQRSPVLDKIKAAFTNDLLDTYPELFI